MVYCSNCGKQTIDEAQYCAHCGAPIQNKSAPETPSFVSQHGPPASPQSTYVENHLAKAIIVTLLCCLPLGIVAIVYAAGVNGKVQAGDIAGAKIDSAKANTWANWGIGLGITVVILYLLFMGIGLTL